MTNPDWVAEGIEWAERVGGVALEIYTRPGFTGGQKAVRPYTSGGGSAFESTDSEGLWWIENAKGAYCRRSAVSGYGSGRRSGRCRDN